MSEGAGCTFVKPEGLGAGGLALRGLALGRRDHAVFGVCEQHVDVQCTAAPLSVCAARVR